MTDRGTKSKKKLTPSRAARDAFLRLIETELLSWGLQRHPSPRSYYGGSDYGYSWDFADTSDLTNVRLVSFSIINPGQSLIVDGRKDVKAPEDLSLLPVVHSRHSTQPFRLTPKWSIWRPLTAYFKLRQRRNQSPEDAAEILMSSVRDRLPLLWEFLYARK